MVTDREYGALPLLFIQWESTTESELRRTRALEREGKLDINPILTSSQRFIEEQNLFSKKRPFPRSGILEAVGDDTSISCDKNDVHTDS